MAADAGRTVRFRCPRCEWAVSVPDAEALPGALKADRCEPDCGAALRYERLPN